MGFAYAGTGDVLKVQKMMQVCAKENKQKEMEEEKKETDGEKKEEEKK